MWTKLKAVLTSKPAAPKQKYDMIAVLLFKQVVQIHQRGIIIFSQCQTLTEQKERILKRAGKLGLVNTNITALSDHIAKLETII